MKTVSLALLLMASLAFVMLGCSDNSNSLVTPTEQSIASSSSPVALGKAEAGVLNTVTGSAHWRSIPAIEDLNMTYTFTAIRHDDGGISGEVFLKDFKLFWKGKGQVYDLQVSKNTAKLAVHFTAGNLGGVFDPPSDITEIFGWLYVVDNGEGSNASGPDFAGLLLFTNGSDILDKKISDVDNMDIPTFLAWMHDELLPSYGVSYDDWLAPIGNGSVRVR